MDDLDENAVRLVCLAGEQEDWPASIGLPGVGLVSVERADAVSALPSLGATDHVAVTLDSLDDGAAEALRIHVGGAGDSRVLAFSSSHWGTQPLAERLQELQPNILLRRSNGRVDVREVEVTLAKMTTGDIFGVERYLGDSQHRIEFALQSTDNLPGVLDGADTFLCATQLHKRIAGQVLFALDELLTNALFNATLDSEGEPVHRSADRASRVDVPDGKHVTVEMCTDGHTLGIGVTDWFGSLSASDLRAHLLEGAGPGRQTVRPKGSGGAGIGLNQVVRAVSRLVFNIDPGERTEVIALFDMLPSYRGYIQQPKSVAFFTRNGGGAE